MNIESGPQRLLVAEPRGLCAGVVRSLEAFDNALTQNPGQVLYSVGEPAHNTHINNRYREKGVRFVASVAEVPKKGKALLGPHGTEVEQIQQAKDRKLTVWDTTCPLVTKVENEIRGYTSQDTITIYWGDPKHQEAKSAISSGDVILVKSLKEALSKKVYKKTKGKRVAFASQTTFNADEAIEMEEKLRQKRYPDLIIPNVPDRCYATRNRQAAVKKMINEEGATFIVIVGSKESSNSRRLYEVALESNKKRKKKGLKKSKKIKAAFVDNADDLKLKPLSKHRIIGFESGASVEEDVFQRVVDKVKKAYGLDTEPVVAADESRIIFKAVKVTDYKLPQFVHQN